MQGPPARFANGTPWPAPAQVPTAEIDDPFLDDGDELDADLTEPVPLLAEAEELPAPPGSSMVLEVDDIGTRTLMGVGARAVRAVATSGLVEARPARGRQATPGGLAPSAPLPGVDSGASARVIVSPPEIAPVQPVLVPEVPSLAQAYAASVREIAPAAPSAGLPAYVEPPQEAVSTTYVRGWAYAIAQPPSKPVSRNRVFIAVAIAIAVFALAAYLTATML